jgi:CBS domain-containing protein
MSPRAAARLDSLGFTKVYDYVAGKADWGSAGLPLEGDDPSEHRAGAHVRTDVPTCRLDERLADAQERAEKTGWETCLVVDGRGVLLGRLGRRTLRRQENVSVEQAMTPGPSTLRPSARLAPVLERMRKQDLTGLPVTTSSGRLVGFLLRDDVDAVLRERGES